MAFPGEWYDFVDVKSHFFLSLPILIFGKYNLLKPNSLNNL